MPRTTKSAAKRRKHNRVLKAAKGFRGSLSRRYRLARTAVLRAGLNATRDRKRRKRDFRALWITRLSAACRQRGLRYSQVIAALFDADIDLNRKMLSEIAIADPAAFDEVLKAAKLEIKAAE